MRGSTKGRKAGPIVLAVAGLVVVAIVAGVIVRLIRTGPAHRAGAASVPVVATSAGRQNVPIYYDALGTVSAFNTVAIHAQVNGQLVSINFRQGQDVRKGDVLARIDPAPFKAALDQAVAKKGED